ncbi:MAG: hypothetical protein HY747_05825 [Elusimicrobia bacterium]|nr:hypothetical protein [Elusimicrobiota bacterium]
MSKMNKFWFSLSMGLLIYPNLWALESEDLLGLATKAPAAAYKGTRIIINWFGQESQAAEARVYFKPPNLWRQEILSPQGEITRVVVQNKEAEWIWEAESKTLIKRPSGGANGLDNAKLLDLTKRSYRIVSKGSDDVMGKNTAIIELDPKHPGSPKRTVWVDPASGAVFKIKQTNSDGSLATEVHFTDIEIPADLSDSLFEPPQAKEGQVLMEEPRPAVANAQGLPEAFCDVPWLAELPNGFELAKTALMPLGDEEALHFQYNDGLSSLSFFVSPKLIQAGPGSHQIVLTQYEDPGFITSTSAGSVLEWEQADKHFLLIGDLSQPALREIMKFIRNRS